MGEPDRSAQSTKSGIGIVSLLQNVQVVEITAAVAFGRMIGTDNTSVGIALINFLVVVGVAEIVVACSVDNAGAAAPSVVSVGEAKELIVGVEGTDALNVLQP